MSIMKLLQKKLALCIDGGEYEGVSLFAMKSYEYLSDPQSEKDGFLRVIDEDGEPYYYDADAFLKISTQQNGLRIPLRHPVKQGLKRAKVNMRHK